MMSLEQRVRELVAATRNTQQRQEITLSRGLKVVARVNPETDRLEVLTYREKTRELIRKPKNESPPRVAQKPKSWLGRLVGLGTHR